MAAAAAAPDKKMSFCHTLAWIGADIKRRDLAARPLHRLIDPQMKDAQDRKKNGVEDGVSKKEQESACYKARLLYCTTLVIATCVWH